MMRRQGKSGGVISAPFMPAFMYRGRRVLCLAAGLLVASVPGAMAQADRAHGAAEELPAHVLGLFVGNTIEDRRSEEPRDGATVGLEYEYRPSAHWGVGIGVEHAGGGIDSGVLVLPVARHSGPWKFYAGPGIERRDEGTEGLLRVGVEYGFHVGGIEVSPQVDLDLVDGERLFVFGVVFAREL